MRACETCRDGTLDEPANVCVECAELLCDNCDKQTCEGTACNETVCQECRDAAKVSWAQCKEQCKGEMCDGCQENLGQCPMCEEKMCDLCERTEGCAECGQSNCAACGIGKTRCEQQVVCEDCSGDFDCVDCDMCAGYY